MKIQTFIILIFIVSLSTNFHCSVGILLLVSFFFIYIKESKYVTIFTSKYSDKLKKLHDKLQYLQIIGIDVALALTCPLRNMSRYNTHIGRRNKHL